MKNIRILEGDITTARVDAIVNAANPRMLGGGGVDGAIHRAAGPKLLEACYQVEDVNGVRCPTGDARITTAGNLPSKFVIHTVGPIYGNEINPKGLLQAAYLNSLQLARNYKCQSVAFPAISCGAFGYPIQEAAMVSLSICSRQEFKELNISFFLFGSQVTAIWQAVFDQLSSS
mgnify:CR=1 FL=1